MAFEYTYNGIPHQVGELSDLIPVDPQNPSVIYVKMMKSTTQRVDLPIWDLMMKNFYRVGGGDIKPEEFQLDVFYDDPGEGFKRFLPASTGVGNTPLITLLNLDNLNVTGDPQSDGRFDFVPGLTIYPQQGLVMFPVLEPFGSSLEKILEENGTTNIDKYLYKQLYDSTLTRAQEFPENNRYTIKGKSESSTSADISLGSFNIPKGSVSVYAGGQRLQENVDYEINYSLGQLHIINPAYIQPGTPIKVSFEDNALFSFQKKTMLGLRADYEVNKHLSVGATYMHLFERPYTEKVNIGDDPINNRVFGMDVAYSNDAPWITKLVDKLPVISTKEPSKINFQAEVAALKPGHSRAIDVSGNKGGVVYIDDFEGTSSEYDLRSPETRWQISSVPQGAIVTDIKPTELFPESELHDTLITGVNRAHLNWYRIDRSIRSTSEDLNNPYTKAVNQQEIFQGRTLSFGNNDFRTFDLDYIPYDRGAYNFDPPQGTEYSSGINSDCELNTPKSRWGGITRDIPNTDFELSNYEAVEFWVLNPYILDSLGGDGYLVINLGNVSEDVLKDGRMSYEHGLPGPNDHTLIDTTRWGRVPRVQPVVNAFSNDPDTRRAQDVGLDGLSDNDERTFYKDYVNAIQNSTFPIDCKNKILDDPADDDFTYFRASVYDSTNANILQRYRRFNGLEGNSPPTPQSSQYITANTNRPNSEDLNDDLSLSDGDEAYYQYVIKMQRAPGTNKPIFTSIGKDNLLVDWELDTIKGETGTWYRFKIPLDDGKAINGIQGFRSIRFMRMYMTGFDQRTILRFATLDLVRSQWRRFTRQDTSIAPGYCFGPTETFEIDAVNIEQNGKRTPFPYVLPEGIRRERIVGSTFQDIFQNEQSLSMQFCDLGDGCDKRIYRNLNLDMRVFKELLMFAHAENNDQLNPQNVIQNGDLSIFIRLGSDFENNYYEYELPLTVSKDPGAANISDEVWKPDSNNIDFKLEELTNLKIERNVNNVSPANEYEQASPPPEQRYTLKIKGNPTLGYVKQIMIGIRHRTEGPTSAPLCGEVWINELRLAGLDERGGVAATARVDMDLADFGTLGASATYSSIGYGAINQKLDDRAKSSNLQLDLSTSLQLGQFFGKNAGIHVPFYAQYSATIETPRYDPIDLDLELKDKLQRQTSAQARDSIRKQAEDYQALRVINVTNVHKDHTGQGPPMPWSVSNFTVSYAYSESQAHNEVVSKDAVQQHRGQLDYNYALPALSLQPFKNLSKSNWLKPITELNLDPLPKTFAFSTVIDRRFGERDYRFSDPIFKTWFDKRYTWDRDYTLSWDVTHSIKVDFNAANASVIDEPNEYKDRDNLIRITKQERTDSIWNNLKHFGRTKDYTHNVRASYRVPTNLFPFLDWVRADVSYDAEYGWDAASINTDSLGNVIHNGQDRTISADLDFTRLYSKSKFLGKISGRSSGGATRQSPRTQQPLKPKQEPDKNNKGDDKGKGNNQKSQQNADPSTLARILIRPLLTIRRFKLDYRQEYTTVIPGFTPKAKFLGMQDFTAPGWGFIFGIQPDIGRFTSSTGDWLQKVGYQGSNWITDNAFQNQPILQTDKQTLDGKLTLEPFTDFKVEVNANRTVADNFSLFYKDVTKEKGDNAFERRTPREVGSFSISYLTLPTLFGDSPDQLMALFNKFEAYRSNISQERGVQGTTHPLDGSAYTEGFGSKQRDVIIPAFIAAYTGKSPENFNVSDMLSWIPRPNWQLTYNGLQKISLFKDIFSSVRITHGYKSTLSINSFETDLNYQPPQINPDNINSTTQNYYSRYVIPAVGIDEQFSPLIGIDVRTKNDMNIQFEFSKRRMLQLGFVSSELAETRGTTVNIGFDWTVKNVELKFLPGFKANKDTGKPPPGGGFPQQPGGGGGSNLRGNDLEFLFDFGFTDNITVNHYLDLDTPPQATRGQKELSISPAIKYNLNKSINLRFFVDYRRTEPYTTAQYPITTTEGGITVQVVLQ